MATRITARDVEKWAAQQRRQFHAGTLEPWKIAELRAVNFDFGKKSDARSDTACKERFVPRDAEDHAARDSDILAHQAATKNLITEGELIRPGELNLWTTTRIKKWLRPYSLGVGPTLWGKAKYRYRPEDVRKAESEMLAAEPKNRDGTYKNAAIEFLMHGQGSYSRT